MQLDLNALGYNSSGRNNAKNIFITEGDDNQASWAAGGNSRLNTAKSDQAKRGFLTAAKFENRYSTRAR